MDSLEISFFFLFSIIKGVQIQMNKYFVLFKILAFSYIILILFGAFQ